jgi:hypothetical protein
MAILLSISTILLIFSTLRIKHRNKKAATEKIIAPEGDPILPERTSPHSSLDKIFENMIFKARSSP